jgi:hypothetical protein
MLPLRQLLFLRCHTVKRGHTIRTLPPELQTRFTVLEGTLSSFPTDQLQ